MPKIKMIRTSKPCGYVKVWRWVRAGGDTKTKKSRRSLGIPQRCIDALRAQQGRHNVARDAAGETWRERGLVFASEVGTELGAKDRRLVSFVTASCRCFGRWADHRVAPP